MVEREREREREERVGLVGWGDGGVVVVFGGT
jgi:hypothetical protein